MVFREPAALRRALLALALAAAPAPAALADPGALPDDLVGYYRGRGLTTEKASGLRRTIRGTLLLTRQDGEPGYEVRFSFRTQFSTPDGNVRADLIGTGEAAVEGERLEGMAETQVIWAAIPGIDPRFAFIPGRLGPRIQSRFGMEVADEPETFRAEIRTVAVPGFEYAETRTTLRIERISRDDPQDDRLPPPH